LALTLALHSYKDKTTDIDIHRNNRPIPPRGPAPHVMPHASPLRVAQHRDRHIHLPDAARGMTCTVTKANAAAAAQTGVGSQKGQIGFHCRLKTNGAVQTDM
jgi:hypothetical protein